MAESSITECLYLIQGDPVFVRERSSQRRVVTGQDRQSVLQMVDLLLSRPHVVLQAADPPELVREDSLQTRIFLIRATFLNLIGAKLLSEIHD